MTQITSMSSKITDKLSVSPKYTFQYLSTTSNRENSIISNGTLHLGYGKTKYSNENRKQQKSHINTATPADKPHNLIFYWTQLDANLSQSKGGYLRCSTPPLQKQMLACGFIPSPSSPCKRFPLDPSSLSPTCKEDGQQSQPLGKIFAQGLAASGTNSTDYVAAVQFYTRFGGSQRWLSLFSRDRRLREEQTKLFDGLGDLPSLGNDFPLHLYRTKGIYSGMGYSF